MSDERTPTTPESSQDSAGTSKPSLKERILMQVRGVFRRILSMDKAAHAHLESRFPKALAVFDAVFEGFFKFLINPAFGVILALVLGVLGVTGIVSAWVAASVVVAWLVAVLWIARSSPIRRLSVVSRMVVVITLAVVLAFLGRSFGKWALQRYEEQQAKQKQPQAAPPTTVATPNQVNNSEALDPNLLLRREASMNAFLYPTGTVVGGIRWQPNLVDVRLHLTTGSVPIQNLDLEIRIDEDMKEKMGIADVKESNGIPCAFLPEMFPGVPSLSRDRMFGPVQTDRKGNRVTKPANVTQIISPMYRVQCAYLQKNTTLSLMIAAAEIKAQGADGTTDKSGRFVTVITGPVKDTGPRRFPQTISIRGTFETNRPNGIGVNKFSHVDKLEVAK